ncbi:MAG: serine/threonine protein kinase [Rhodanobacteraceae bacterium]|nr:serine/threonine protein kinase [Rhodanobacteraceae bacterium]
MPTPEAGFDARRALQEFERLSELSDDACTQALAELAAAAPALAAEVRALLVADAAQGLLDRGSPMALIVEQDMEQARVDRSGEVIGAYQLIARIGRGGMGDVYRASRDTDGFRQIVALKLLRRGLDTGEMVRRFVQERRILARLEHPGIARMIDGGLSHDGLPWLAMELIDGLPITEFARRAGLSLRARIELVLAVCDAVDYAHRRLIVHRDLKPSNVLVTPEATPRLLDFGIAKLLDQDEDGTLTGTGMHLLSPVYAAPEQFSGEPVGITTDVYALGLMLYELLTETLPQQRRDTALAALHQAVLSPPAPPSSVFAAMTDRSSSLSVRALVGDLDTITLKALALEPDRRYASAAALADDLRRYLDGHPIAARPDTLSYRVGKFVRRHRGGVSAAAISLIALIAGFGFALWQTSIARDQALRADTEARRAEIQATRATEMGARTKRVKTF